MTDLLGATPDQVAAVLRAARERTDEISGTTIPGVVSGGLWIYTDDAVRDWLGDLAHRVAEGATEL